MLTDQQAQWEEARKKIFRDVIVPRSIDELNAEGLLSLGFTAHAKGSKTVYRIRPCMYYPHQLEIELRTHLPHENGNSGVLSIFLPELNLEGKSFPERTQPIAWSVTTYKRLRKIITSLIES